MVERIRMKQTLSTTQAADILKADDNANWTYRGSLRLIEYYEELEEMDSEEMELDVVAIRCEWTEYDKETLELDFRDAVRDDESILDYLKDHTIVIEVEQYSEPNTYLVMEF
jgi:hypothetical protein